MIIIQKRAIKLKFKKVKKKYQQQQLANALELDKTKTKNEAGVRCRSVVYLALDFIRFQ